MEVLVLFGAKGSGKDTVGNYLAMRHGFMKASFAAPLKRMAKLAFPHFSDEDLYGPSKSRENQYRQYPMGSRCLKCDSPLADNGMGGLTCTREGCITDYPKYVNPRIALQTLGAEWGRRLYEHIWVDNLFLSLQSLRECPSGPSRIVVTDGRFDNERARTSELGGKTVLLLRKLEEASRSSHASERELTTIPLNKFHYVLDNRGPEEELPGAVDRMLRVLDVR